MYILLPSRQSYKTAFSSVLFLSAQDGVCVQERPYYVLQQISQRFPAKLMLFPYFISIHSTQQQQYSCAD